MNGWCSAGQVDSTMRAGKGKKKSVHPLSVCTAYQEMWLYSSINRLPLIPLEEIIVVGYCVWPEGQYIVFIPNHLYKCYISPLSRFLISLWNWRSVVYLSLRSYIFCVHLLGSHHNFFGRWLFFFFYSVPFALIPFSLSSFSLSPLTFLPLLLFNSQL